MILINRFIIFVIFYALALFNTFAQEVDVKGVNSISAKQLVVMIDGRFPTTGDITKGAGIVVGRADGFVFIATAGHVVQGLLEKAVDIKVQFLDRAGDEINARLMQSNFDKGLDIAILAVPESKVPASITSLNEFAAARISQEMKTGEGVYLFGQPSGKVWNGNKNPEKIVSSTTTAIEVESNSVVPGMSGGATFDERLRLVGLIIETDNGLARAIPLRLLKETLENAGFPFNLKDTKSRLPNSEFDPLRELTARGYQLSNNSGFLGASGAASREFQRALSIGRKQDAELFIQAGIKLSVERIFEEVAVPEDFAMRIKDGNLNSKNTISWCGNFANSNSHEKMDYLVSIKNLIDNSNRYAIDLFCSDDEDNLERLLKNTSEEIENEKEIEKSAISSKENIVNDCKIYFRERIPVSEIVESMFFVRKMGGKNLAHDALNIRAQQDVENFVERFNTDGIEVILGTRMAGLRPPDGFISIWEDFERRFWSLTSPTYLGNPQQIRASDYAPHRLYIKKHLLPLIDKRCSEYIRVTEVPFISKELEKIISEIDRALR